MAVKELNVKGLTPEEAQTALNSARQWKNKTLAEMEEMLEETKQEIRQLVLRSDDECAAEILKIIKEHHPELFDTEKTV